MITAKSFKSTSDSIKQLSYLELLGRFVDFNSTITAFLVPFKCFEHARCIQEQKRPIRMIMVHI
jgi:hypothetical protein